ncbi:MAG: molybdopterin-dependent oxidoreductase [Chloroflexi bacterium]|nr:molybdopterin-dependent oxidoreductase [Chloroflexota bacterium]
MVTRNPIILTVNGERREIETDPDRTLLDVLREDLDLTGAKVACDGGECGSCIVLFGGKGVMSCLLPVSRAQGKEIITIEGLAPRYLVEQAASRPTSDSLHPLQQAFIDLGASQCGFCIPGIIMEASALLNRHPNPTRQEVVKRLSRNICRCTGYIKVIDAVLQAAEALQGAGTKEADTTRGGPIVGVSVVRLDDRDKVTGAARYAADLKMEGMLYARVLRSPHHHARITSIDTSEAEAMSGVEAVVTARDIPGKPEMPNGKPQTFLFPRDKVRFLGEAVAAVAAISEEIAEEALRRIHIEYEPLPPVLDFLRAGSEDAPLINPPEPNVVHARRVISGDARKGLEQAYVVVENTFTTPRWEHFYMEPEAGLACLDQDGRLLIRFPSHEAFEGHTFISGMMNMERDRIRIICPEMGGNFGGREDYLHAGVLALLTMKTRMPVRLVYSREESLLGSSKWYSFHIKCRTGAARDGRLVALESDILVDGGSWSHNPGEAINDCLSRNAYFLTGPYRVPNVRIEANEACTNSPRAIPIRGITSIQSALVHETQMDMLAEKLGMDKLDIRIINALEVGDRLHTGMVLEESVGTRATLEAIREPYDEARALAISDPPEPPWKRGVGLGCGWRAIGVGGRFEAATELLEDGHVRVLVGAVEKGQGSKTAMAQIAAEELGVPIESVEIVMGDTIGAPYPHITASQGTITLAGGAVHDAAKSLRKAMTETASELLEDSPDNIQLQAGYAFSLRTPADRISFQQLAAHFREKGIPTKYEGAFAFKHAKTYSEKSTLQAFDPETGQGSNCDVFGYATTLAEVDVNTEKGQVKVLRVVYAADSGKIIHPLSYEGQCEGGIVFGMGLTLTERYVPGETRTIKAYGLPTIAQAPEEIRVIAVEGEYSRGPFGAKGGGEMSDVPIVAAIVNAIADATGARIFDLPATPERVLEAIAKRCSE